MEVEQGGEGVDYCYSFKVILNQKIYKVLRVMVNMEYEAIKGNEMDTCSGARCGGLKLEMIGSTASFPNEPRILIHGQNYAKLKSIVMEGNSRVLGRKDVPRSNVSGMVSRNHCLIRKIGDEYSVVDLSMHGTLHNGVKMINGTSEELKKGDTLRLMGTEFYVSDE